jgi:tetratricopeptide (TPR) repeat protein
MYKKIILISFVILAVCSAIYALMDRRPVTTSSDQAYKAYQKGVDYSHKLYIQEALHEFERAVKLDPQFAMAHMRAAALYWEFERTDELEESKNKAMALIDKVKDIERLQILISFSRIDRSEKDLEKYSAELLDRYPDHFDAVQYLSSKYFGDKKYRESEEATLKLISLDPEYALGYNSLGYIYFYLGEPEKSLEYLKKYLEIAEGQANPHDSMGEILMNLGYYDKAMQEFLLADSIKPNLDFVIAHIGDCYTAKGMLRDAVGAYMKAIELSRNRITQIDQIIKIARCYYYMDKPDEAIAVLEEAVEETPDNVFLQAYLGSHYALSQEMDKALVQLGIVKGIITRSWAGEDQADSTEPEIPYIQLALEARIASERGLHDESIEKIEKALEQLLPYNSGGTWRRLADVYIKAGRPDSAIAFLNRALAWNPNSGLCLKSLADAYELKGMKKEQAQTLERFLVVAKDADENLKGLHEARATLARLEGSVL